MESTAVDSTKENPSANWMAVRWKTISRRDPEFMSYLDGSFSSEERALPVRSLNVATLSEEVTFEIVSLSSIESPGLFKAAWLLMRPTTLVLSFGPMLAILMHAIARGQEVRGTIAAFSFIGVLLFHAAVNLFNDYYDHVTGQDRLRLKGGSRVIQKGWMRALDVKRVAWGLMGLAAACALPAVYFHFSPVAVVAGLAALAGLEFAFDRLGLKYRGFAEVMAFALTGPLLTAGYAWSITGEVSLGDAALGCVFGAISLMYFHLSNFENIMADKQAGVRTWATRTGFDASKTFFYFTAALTLGTMAAYLAFFDHDWRLLPTFAAQLVFLVPLARRVHELASPLSSDLTGIRKEALKLSWLTLAVFVAGCLR